MNTLSSTPPDIGIHPSGRRLPATTHLGRVRLAVSSLERSLRFYTEVVGLQCVQSDARHARLAPQGSGNVLLELELSPGVQPIAPGSRLGLYHTAFLLPGREYLGAFVRHLRQQGVPFGAGDHIYSEAIYLTDPDGLTVEVYADRERSNWQFEGREIVSATNPVRLQDLTALSGEPWRGAPSGTTVGHIHLYVGHLDQAAAFYHQALGLDLVTWRYPGALFLSAGGYHHHVAVNTWAAGSPAASDKEARLLVWELVLPTPEDVARTATRLHATGFQQSSRIADTVIFGDPWGIQVALKSQVAQN